MVSDEIVRECQAVVANHDLDLDKLSPFWIHAIYQIAAACLQLQGAPVRLVGIEEQPVLTQALKIYDRRWKCAGNYLCSLPPLPETMSSNILEPWNADCLSSMKGHS